MSFASLSIPLRHHTDAQDMSEHIGARLCCGHHFLCLFNVSRIPKARASTPVLAHILYVLFSCLFNTLWTCRTRVSTPVLTCVLYIICFMSFQHPVDAQDTSEHASARPCPVRHLFHVPLTSRGCAGHERACRCLPMSCMSFFHVPSTPHGCAGHE